MHAGVKFVDDLVCMYGEDFKDEGMKKVSEDVVKTVMRKENVEKNFEVVMKCLMKLPPSFLDCVEYGEEHSEKSELSVRMKYISVNGKKLNEEEKRIIMRKCDLRGLNTREMMDLVDKGMIGMMELVKHSLEKQERMEEREKKMEKEIEELKERIKILESKSEPVPKPENVVPAEDKEMKKARELLKRMPELETNTEITWKEKGAGENLRLLSVLLKGNATQQRNWFWIVLKRKKRKEKIKK